MDRREFLKASGSVAVLGTVAQSFNVFADNTLIFNTLVQQNDEHISQLLQNQEMDKSHQWYGGIKDKFGIHFQITTAKFISALTSAYVTPESKYFQSKTLLKPLEIAAQYMVNVQHEDGSIDLLSTNFHSTPDTAFVIEWIGLAYSILDQNKVKELGNVKSQLAVFMKRAGEILSVGGIHTPNHRWVVCMGLSWIHTFFPNDKYIQRIDQWLNEKIDIDSDGQFNEKSTAIYSPTIDRCLITVARLLDRKELLDPVRKNLDMSMYYVHPNGDVDTTASKRQDQGKRMSPAPYYYSYRYMALKDKNSQFSAMCELIEKTALSELTGQLPFIIQDKSLLKNLPSSVSIPTNYARYFKNSNVVRIRRGETSATIAVGNTTFFSFHKKNAALEGLRLALSFFGQRGQFVAKSLQIDNNRYILKAKSTGPYYQPYPVEKLPEDGDWEKMPRSNRPHSEIQILESEIVIMENNGAFDINISTSGTERVPYAIEMGFRKGGVLKGVTSVRSIENAYLLESGFGSYTLDGTTIQFGPGQTKHTWTQLRGAVPKQDAMSVYITGFSPVKYILKIS